MSDAVSESTGTDKVNTREREDLSGSGLATDSNMSLLDAISLELDGALVDAALPSRSIGVGAWADRTRTNSTE